MTLPEALTLLRNTRRLTVGAVICLAVQLFGNLYEQVVTNARTIAEPRPGSLGGELTAGSPVFYYLPWAPLGVVLAVVLAVRLHRTAPGWIARRGRAAVLALLVAVAAKAVLISSVNPLFRDPAADVDTLRAYAVGWAFGNGVAIAAVAAALLLIASWRVRILDTAPVGATTAQPAPA